VADSVAGLIEEHRRTCSCEGYRRVPSASMTSRNPGLTLGTLLSPSTPRPSGTPAH
jgi:hypothetical protein